MAIVMIAVPVLLPWLMKSPAAKFSLLGTLGSMFLCCAIGNYPGFGVGELLTLFVQHYIVAFDSNCPQAKPAGNADFRKIPLHRCCMRYEKVRQAL